VYPGWVDAVGWLLALSSVIFIPGAMIYKLCKEDDGDTILEVSYHKLFVETRAVKNL
jgi:hypothetical protein